MYIFYFRMIVLALLLFITVNAADWAVIIAGSDGYWNYRHHAAAASAYHYYIARGIPNEQIITFMSSNVAKDEKNPYFGKLYSFPGQVDDNKMKDVVIDYGGAEITSSKVLNVLSGNSFSSKRVLRSSAFDNVYISVFEYGAPGVITLPKDVIMGSDLKSTIQLMKDRRMYKELFLILDGEGTELLLSDADMNELHVKISSPHTMKMTNTNIFCPPEDKVGGKSIGRCLNTRFAYKVYEGCEVAEKAKPYFPSVGIESNEVEVNMNIGMNGEGWSIYDSKFEDIMRRMALDPSNAELRREMLGEDNIRGQIEQYIRALISVRKIGKNLTIISEWSCYQRGIKKVEKLFFWNEYTFRFFSLIAIMCEQNERAF